MHRLAELSVRRPVLASVLILGLVFLGLVSYSRLTVERWPNIDIPFVAVSVRVPGASPEEVESDVTNKIESAVNTISGIDRLSSTSAEGFAIISLQFHLEKDIDVAAQEVRDKINGVLRDLPAGIDPPVISKFDPGAIPVITLALSADRPIRDITEYADKVVRPRLEGTRGVGQVEIIGGQARQINVLVDPARLMAYSISTTDVSRSLQAQNVQIPAGSIDRGMQRLTLRTLGRVSSLDELQNLVVVNRGGVPVTLADLARIEDGAAEPETTANIDGTPAVLLQVRKQSGTNTIQVAREIKARLGAIESTLAPGYHVALVRDQSVFVVLENIYRFMQEKGMPPLQAAIEGTREVGGAVTATTMSLIAVFLPLAFMSGIVGRFMRSFGYTMAFAIAVSLLVSFTLTPMMSARWLRPRRAGSGHEGSGKGRIFSVMEAWYRRLLEASLRRRWVVVVLTVLTLFSVAPLGMAVNKNFLPEDDTSQFEVVVRAPEGWNLNATERLGTQMAADIRRLPGITYTIVTTGDDPQHSANRFTIYARMADVEQRSVSQDSMIIRVRNEVLPRYAPLGLHTQVGPASEFGGSGQFQPIEYVIGGPDLAVLTRAAQAGEKVLREIPGVVDVRSSLIGGRPQLGLTGDRPRAADLGGSVLDAASALRVLVAGTQGFTFAEGGEQDDIYVPAAAPYRSDLTALSQFTIGSAKLGAVPLEQVVQARPGTGPGEIEHFSRRRQVTLTANLLPGTSQSTVLQQLDRGSRALRLGPEYAIEPAGQAAEQGRQAQAFMTAFLLSFVFMYLVLAAQFESWLHPITILLSLPLTVPFAFVSILMLHGSLNILSQLGILVLFGVVKKNAILQIDHANQLRAQGMERDVAILAPA